MKRTMILTALVAAAWLGSSSVSEAGDWGVRFGIGNRGLRVNIGYSHSHRRSRSHFRRHYRHERRHHVRRHVCVRAPLYGRVWVPATYNRVVVGHDHCGRPIFRRVCVSAGYYRNTITGYHCGGCGRRW